MSLILAIDSAAEACSVALYDTRDAEVLRERHELAPRRQAGSLVPMIDSLLGDCGKTPTKIDVIAFGRGPGSFTGLRVAAAAVQGLAWGLDRPVLPVSSLAALALQARRLHSSRRILALLDARMDQVYWAAYRAAGDAVEPVVPEQVSDPESVIGCLKQESQTCSWLQDTTDKVMAVGPGCSYGARLGLEAVELMPQVLPRAGDIARLAATLWQQEQAIDASQALPVYIRNTVASKKPRLQRA